MKDHLALCLQYLEEVESKIVELQRNPRTEIGGQDLAAISEAMSFVQHAIAAVRQTQKEIAHVPDEAIRINGHMTGRSSSSK